MGKTHASIAWVTDIMRDTKHATPKRARGTYSTRLTAQQRAARAKLRTDRRAKIAERRRLASSVKPVRPRVSRRKKGGSVLGVRQQIRDGKLDTYQALSVLRGVPGGTTTSTYRMLMAK